MSLLIRYFLLSVFSLMLTAQVAAEEQIGVILPLSGELAAFGAKVRRGIELAKSELPGSSFIFEDGGADPRSALSAYKKLRHSYKITKLVGPFGPGQTQALAREVARDKVSVWAVSMCEKQLLSLPYIQCSYPSPREQVNPLFDNLSKQNKSSPRTIFLGIESDFSAAHYELVKQRATEGRIKLVDAEILSRDTHDFAAVITRYRKETIDLAIVSGPEPQQLIRLLREMTEQGVRPRNRWFLSEADDTLFTQHHHLFEGVLLEASPTRFSDRFNEVFKGAHQEEPDLYSALGYDLARLAAEQDPAAIPLFRILPNKDVFMDLKGGVVRNGKRHPH